MESQEAIDPTGVLENHAVAEPYTPSHEERELVARLEERFGEAERARLNWERDANFYRLYLQGNQLILRSRTTNEVLRATVITDNTRNLHSIDNILRPVARAMVGKLSKIIPTCAVLPASDDASDLRSAKVGESFLEYQSRRLRMRTKYVRAMGQLQWAGSAILQLYWDKNGGETIAWCGTCNHVEDEEHIDKPCPACQMENEAAAQDQTAQAQAQWEMQAEQAAMMGMPQPEPPMPVEPQPAPILKETRNGDIGVKLHDPRDCYPEPGQANIEDMRIFTVRVALPVSKLRQMFPEKARFIHNEDGIYTDRTLGFYGSSYDSRGEAEVLQDYAYLYEFHEVPTAMHPKGRIIYKVNDMIVGTADENPCWFLGRLGFYHLRMDENEGEFWGETWIAQAWHIQKERNKLASQLRAQRELTLYPQKLVPLSSRISVGEWDNQPGRIITYNPMGGKPTYGEVPQFPNYTYQEMDRMHGAIREKPGVTDQEVGRSTGDPSGRFAAILEAQSSESIAPIVVPNTDEWKELHRGIILMGQKFYQPERLFTITGRDRIRTYAAREFIEMSPGWDIELHEEDSLSKNPALRLQQAERLLGAGVFNDEQGMPDRRLFARVAGLKLPGIGVDHEAGERAYASQIPYLIETNSWGGPMPWDDAVVMAEELLLWLRGEGRNARQDILAAVGQAWQVYMGMLGEDVEMPSALETQPQAEGTGEPGTGTMGAGAQPQQSQPMAVEASQQVQMADQQAEQAVQGGPHEG